MGGICVHEFMSLDGVIDSPSWTFDYGFDPKMAEAISTVMNRSKGILLGRATYELFEQSWPTRTVEDDEAAPFFNDTTKYVVSGTLANPAWKNTDVVGAYNAAAIHRLTGEVDGDLYVSGSGTLVRALLQDELVDELHLCMYPLTRGAGPRLFTDAAAPHTFSLEKCESYPNGVIYLFYQRQA